MRVFVTGATGFVGSAVVQDLIQAGHQVTGLARSDASAAALAKTGAKVHRGDLTDLESLRLGVQQAEGIIHTGFVHDFANMKASCEIENKALEAIGKVFADSNKPIVITSGTALVSPGKFATEEMVAPAPRPNWPRASEESAEKLKNLGIKASIIRLSPSVHGDGDKGFIPMLIAIAEEKGVSAYVGEGKNSWSAVHRLDAAPLYRFVLEKASGGDRFHGVAEEAIAFKKIAEVIGKKLNIPVVSKTAEEAAAHFGWFANFAMIDCPASNKITREKLGWSPKQAGLIEDIEKGKYF